MKLAVETLGRGPELVLLHGWAMNSAVWQPLVRELERNFRITLVDLPGHGRSPWPRDARELEAWAELVLEIAPPEAAWLGWSLGGLVMLQAAAMQPRRITALVGVATTPSFVQRPGWQTAMEPELLGQFGQALETDREGTIRRFLALQFHGVEQGRELQRELRAALAKRPPVAPGALRNGLSLLRHSDLREVLDRLVQPQLWLLGGRDRLVPRELAQALPRMAPGARVRLLEPAGHAPFLSHPDQVADSLREFLLHG